MKRFAIYLIVPTLIPTLASAEDPKSKSAANQVLGDPTKPSAELVELATAMSGTWKCTGKASRDGTTMSDMKATISNRTDLDKWWMQTNLTARFGKETYKFTGFTGYNHAELKFYRYRVDNMGNAEWSSATGIDHGMAGKWAINWEGEQRLGIDVSSPPPADPKAAREQAIEDARKTTSGPTVKGANGATYGTTVLHKNVVKSKHSESMSKDGLAISGEMSIDGGKTWVKAYDATCKK